MASPRARAATGATGKRKPDEKSPEHKRRQRDSQGGHEDGEPIEHRVAPDRGNNARGHAETHADEQGQHAQMGGDGESIGEDVLDPAVAVFEARAEVAAGEVGHVIKILFPHRLVEVILGEDVLLDLGREALFLVKGPAGHGVHDEKGNGGDHEDHDGS